MINEEADQEEEENSYYETITTDSTKEQIFHQLK